MVMNTMTMMSDGGGGGGAKNLNKYMENGLLSYVEETIKNKWYYLEDNNKLDGDVTEFTKCLDPTSTGHIKNAIESIKNNIEFIKIKNSDPLEHREQTIQKQLEDIKAKIIDFSGKVISTDSDVKAEDKKRRKNLEDHKGRFEENIKRVQKNLEPEMRRVIDGYIQPGGDANGRRNYFTSEEKEMMREEGITLNTPAQKYYNSESSKVKNMSYKELIDYMRNNGIPYAVYLPPTYDQVKRTFYFYGTWEGGKGENTYAITYGKYENSFPLPKKAGSSAGTANAKNTTGPVAQTDTGGSSTGKPKTKKEEIEERNNKPSSTKTSVNTSDLAVGQKIRLGNGTIGYYVGTDKDGNIYYTLKDKDNEIVRKMNPDGTILGVEKHTFQNNEGTDITVQTTRNVFLNDTESYGEKNGYYTSTDSTKINNDEFGLDLYANQSYSEVDFNNMAPGTAFKDANGNTVEFAGFDANHNVMVHHLGDSQTTYVLNDDYSNSASNASVSQETPAPKAVDPIEVGAISAGVTATGTMVRLEDGSIGEYAGYDENGHIYVNDMPGDATTQRVINEPYNDGKYHTVSGESVVNSGEAIRKPGGGHIYPVAQAADGSIYYTNNNKEYDTVYMINGEGQYAGRVTEHFEAGGPNATIATTKKSFEANEAYSEANGYSRTIDVDKIYK